MATLRNCTLIAILMMTGMIAHGKAAPQPRLWNKNLDAAAFDRTESAGLASAQQQIDKLLTLKGPRTIENTLTRYDAAIRELDTVGSFAELMQQVHPDATFRDHATVVVTKSGATRTAISLNRNIYNALSSMDLANVDDATRYYVQRTLLQFRLSGVDKDDATRARLKDLIQQLTEQVSEFDRNIADDQTVVEVSNASELDGLPQDYIDRHKPDANGKIHLTTNYPDVFPVFQYANSDALRHRMKIAFYNRAFPKNDAVLKQMMRSRYQIAQLLGYPSWADYNADGTMIENGRNIAKFIATLDLTTRATSQREFALILAEKKKHRPDAKEVWDYEIEYYEEQLLHSRYAFDSQLVREYLPYQQVKQGVLDTTAKLFHLTFRQEKNAPAWDSTVETWNAFDDGRMIGRFYLDMHPRVGKFTHAEMVGLKDGVLGKQLPEAALVCNFPAPTANDSGLMSLEDVKTFFHEFGHLMHWLLARQHWAGNSELTMEADFVEAPSQMLEELVLNPTILSSFARHYKTGKPIPVELIARAASANAFGRARTVARQTLYAALSYDIYNSDPDKVDLDTLTADDIKRYTLITESPETHLYASFGHLADYSSAVYTYMWDLVIAQDFYLQFDQIDPISGNDSPMRYRRTVLEPGGSMSANDLVKHFLGREQNMNALQHWIDQEFAESDPPQTDWH